LKAVESVYPFCQRVYPLFPRGISFFFVVQALLGLLFPFFRGVANAFNLFG